MTYILDTNTCIYLLNGNKKVETKIRNTGIYSIAITFAVLSELYYGAYNSGRVRENLRRIDEFKKNLAILQEDAESSRLFGKIKQS
jgi:tRNA(fMet)-specific endonuclease VapC